MRLDRAHRAHRALRPLLAALPVSVAVAGAAALVCLAPAVAQTQTRAQGAATALKVVTADAAPGDAVVAYDGVVEAVRQTTVAAQVPGAVVRLAVKAGDRVAAGQLLVQLDARAAAQTAEASDAQVQAARAALDVAAKDLERQRSLHAANFISRAALDRAEAEFRAAQAQAGAQVAQAGAARTQTGFFTVRAPYAGIVADVPVTLGDMAMPGRTLVTLYDPAALRVTAAVPQSAAARVGQGAAVRVELPTLPAARRMVAPMRLQVLPAADAATHTLTVRADLAPGKQGSDALTGLLPGQFARLWLPAAAMGDTPAATGASPWVPMSAIVRRAELTGLYVLDAEGRPLLRQVRLGRSDGERVEVLSGLAAGERVAAEPQAAARLVAAR
ncbi:MAG: efflux RND transporter periplasmic adaptor subunit [Betaproteobacteria bacterium]|nr:efflux RND transporter periplasmic adaptor subunit [Betaproteobacteria bacterium]